LNEDLFKKKSDQYHVDVDVTNMTHEERQKVLSDHKSKKGFINFSTGWENQFTPNEKMFYIFWYEKEKKQRAKTKT
jgi:hypothetical protein